MDKSGDGLQERQHEDLKSLEREARNDAAKSEVRRAAVETEQPHDRSGMPLGVALPLLCNG